MATDLTGGIHPTRDHVLGECPADPEVHDSVSFWVFDDRGEVGLPRIELAAQSFQHGQRFVVSSRIVAHRVPLLR